jgi:hypothetical protein
MHVRLAPLAEILAGYFAVPLPDHDHGVARSRTMPETIGISGREGCGWRIRLRAIRWKKK